MRSGVITPPAEEPVSLVTAKAHLRVTHSAEDDLITQYVRAARDLCEQASRRSFITQTREVILNLPRYDSSYPYYLGSGVSDPDSIAGGVRLIRGPVQSIESINAYDVENDLTLLDDSVYLLDPVTGRVSWVPDLFNAAISTLGYVRIRYVAGDSPEDFAAKYPGLVQAVLMTLTAIYEERGYSQQSIPPAAWALLTPYWTSSTYSY